jgi:hypothetical protein
MPLKSASANRKDINTAANGVSLQHRHFCFIAATIADLNLPWAQQDAIIKHFADACSHANPKFDRARFIAACIAKQFA